ncbi:hypothetical protein [Flavobacterium sp. 25HG05S-40]|uniref:hypothetical protein n=1 Tax=Flavobacterium sp. 25HG05S-40 TaxID=3458682 RepID=UPI004043C71F
MAKQSGIIKLKSSLDGLSFYILNGEYVVRKPGGFTRDAIKNSPKMDRVRDNNTEFGTTSSVKKLFKDSLRPFFGNQKDGTLHSRMMSLYMQIKDCDRTSVRGARRVAIGLETTEGKELLKRFAFTPHSLDLRNGVYDASDFTFTVNSPGLSALPYLNGATHLELILGIVVLDFDNLKAHLFSSASISIAKETPIPDFSLTPTEHPTGSGMRIAVLTHRYLQEVNGALYPLKDTMVYGLQVLDISH